MHFAGLPLATLLQTRRSPPGPMVVVFYILKLRRRPVAVPFSKIWERILRDKEATSLFSQLKRLLSLLLQLALLALAVLALGDPRTAANLRRGRATSWCSSTRARACRPPTWRRAGSSSRRGGVRRWCAASRRSDRMLRRADGRRPSRRSPTMTERGSPSSRRRVAAVRPTDATADFARALPLRGATRLRGRAAAGGHRRQRRRARARAPTPAGAVRLGDIEAQSFVPIGSDAQNAAITEFSVRRYPLDKSALRGDARGRQHERSRRSRSSSRCSATAQLIDLTRIRSRPKERLPRFYPNLSGRHRRRSRRSSRCADGSTTTCPPTITPTRCCPSGAARVLVVTPGNMYLEAAAARTSTST